MNIGAITLQDIVTAGAILFAIGGYIKSATKPIRDFEGRVKSLEEHQANDNERLKQLESDTKMILRATRVLVEHSYTNNATGKLEKVKTDLDEYLINK